MTARRNHRTEARGIQEITRLTDPSGTGRSTTTLVTVTGIIEEWLNNGAPVHQLKGDGRMWLPVLLAPPGSPTPGDVWLEDDIVDGVVLRIEGPTGTLTLVNGAGLELDAASALLQGHAVQATAGGLAYADASPGNYGVVGVVAEAAAAMGDDVRLLVDGEVLELPNWALLTGAALLTPGSRYWLSTTPGRYSLIPPAAGWISVGIGLTTTKLLVDTQRRVLA